MREVYVDLSNDSLIGRQVFDCGVQGEHNETKLTVKLPKRMSSGFSYYYFSFATPYGELIDGVHISNDDVVDEKVSTDIWSQVAVDNTVVSVVAIKENSDHSVAAKAISTPITLGFARAPSGEETLLDARENKEAIGQMVDSIKTQMEAQIENKCEKLSNKVTSIDTGDGNANFNEQYPTVNATLSAIFDQFDYRMLNSIDPQNETDTYGIPSEGAVIGFVNDKLDNKVDKVNGKGLSTNDYTDNDQASLHQVVSDVEGMGSYVMNLGDRLDAIGLDYDSVKTTLESIDTSEFAGVIKNTVSGNVAAANDISSLNNELSVSLSSNTVTDFSSVSVKKYGKNLINGNHITSNANTFSVSLPAGTYVMSVYNSDGSAPGIKYGSTFAANFKDANNAVVKSVSGQGKFVLTAEEAAKVTQLATACSVAIPSGVYRMYQLECGNTATSFEPYVEPQTVTANADGTVTGLTGVSSSVTLMTDNSAVDINLTYSADTKKYIDKKFAELQAMILEG